MLPDNFKYNELSKIGNFKLDLLKFNIENGTDLVVKPSLRWKPGTYKTLKENAVNKMFPQWLTKSGANTMTKLARYESWNYDRFFSTLKAFDARLRELRAIGVTLDTDVEAEGRAFVNKLNDLANVTTDASPNFQVELSTNPYFNIRDYRGSSKIASIPIFNREGDLISYSTGLQRDLNATSPIDWYVNFKFVIRDVVINLETSTGETGSLPYGNIVLTSSVNLLDLFNLSQGRKNRSSRLAAQAFTARAIGFPHYYNRQHPYICTHGSGYSRSTGYVTPQPADERALYSYQNGNICLGDYQTSIVSSMSDLKLSQTASLLRLWAETYVVGNTSPLNNHDNWIFSINSEWPAELRKRVQVNLERCDRELRGPSSVQYKEEECNHCILQANCETYDRLSLSSEEYNKKHLEYEISEADSAALKEEFAEYKETVSILEPIEVAINYPDTDTAIPFPSQDTEFINTVETAFARTSLVVKKTEDSRMYRTFMVDNWGMLPREVWLAFSFTTQENVEAFLNTKYDESGFLGGVSVNMFKNTFDYCMTLYTYKIAIELKDVLNSTISTAGWERFITDKYIKLAETKTVYEANKSILGWLNGHLFSQEYKTIRSYLSYYTYQEDLGYRRIRSFALTRDED